MGTSVWGDCLQRRFAIIGHRAPSSGALNLNDLAGSGGRMDVLVRAVNAALFISHGIRNDCHITLHLVGGPGAPRRVWFDGSKLRGVHPDERSISGHIKAILKTPVPPSNRFVEVSTGIRHSGGGLKQTLLEWMDEGVACFVLDAKGESPTKIPRDSPVGFFLSDDSPFTNDDLEYLADLKRISLGQKWLQGQACIAILHHLIDQY
ncbi:MAG: tRNA (pseudouridine(54)-N(1))-methyltransferase TrmY [Candidatus Thermoplasmatota archaeon]|nr:tRNA (pseudouridine(54)-N(1))-methyltransferase TrmY [Candidatus Thermoplasmatota archaeon]